MLVPSGMLGFVYAVNLLPSYLLVVDGAAYALRPDAHESPSFKDGCDETSFVRLSTALAPKTPADLKFNVECEDRSRISLLLQTTGLHGASVSIDGDIPIEFPVISNKLATPSEDVPTWELGPGVHNFVLVSVGHDGTFDEVHLQSDYCRLVSRIFSEDSAEDVALASAVVPVALDGRLSLASDDAMSSSGRDEPDMSDSDNKQNQDGWMSMLGIPLEMATRQLTLLRVGTDGSLWVLLVPIGVLVFLVGLGLMLMSRYPEAKKPEPEGRASPTPHRTTSRARSAVSVGPTPRTSSMPPSQSVGGEGVLCAELVVPEGIECALVLPSLVATLEGQVIMRDIFDQKRHPLLQVGITCTPSSLSQNIYSEYVLLSQRNGQELTFCELTIPKSGDGHAKGSIYRWNGNLYAQMVEELASSGYTRTPMPPGHRSFVINTIAKRSQPQQQLRLEGDFNMRQVKATNLNGGITVATVTPADEAGFSPEEHYLLHLQPGADSGLVIVALLAIDRIIDAAGDGRMQQLSSLPVSGRPSFMGSVTSDRFNHY